MNAHTLLRRSPYVLLAVLAVGVVVAAWMQPASPRQVVPPDREEVVFWHFWGGDDREVVEDAVDRFNASQDRYFVRPVAMPGNNLDVKIFLATTGGDPPDVINHDDPIIADWAAREALTPINELASAEEMRELKRELFPAARQLTTWNGRMYGLCNGLDIRALYYNKTLFDELGLQPPTTITELDEISVRASLEQDGKRIRFGYLPDSRRLWAWGIVWGGKFYDTESNQPTVNDPANIAALDWMQSYTRRYGVREIQNFRTGDQSLPNKSFPLLPVGDETAGRYAMLMDGQWRVRDIARFQQDRASRDVSPVEFGVCPLPSPPGGQEKAGWANGNFFIVPRGAKNSQGAWEFMKFWIGLDGHAAQAAATCKAGGWIPVTRATVDDSSFRTYLNESPLFAEFVSLAQSENQIPIPVIPGAPLMNREVKAAGGEAMIDLDKTPAQILNRVNQRIEQHRARLSRSP